MPWRRGVLTIHRLAQKQFTFVSTYSFNLARIQTMRDYQMQFIDGYIMFVQMILHDNASGGIFHLLVGLPDQRHLFDQTSHLSVATIYPYINRPICF